MPRDAEAIRRVATILRYFGPLGFTTSQGWQPHWPVPQGPNGSYASMWPADSGETLWTFVNRGGRNLTGVQLQLPANARWRGAGMHYYDAYHGVELTPGAATAEDGAPVVTLSFEMEASGFGAVLATPNVTTPGAPDALGQFLGTMARLTKRKLASYSWTWQYLLQQMVSPPAAVVNSTSAPLGMKAIKGGVFRFENTGVEIEGDDAHGVDVQYPWEGHPQKEHNAVLTMPDFYLDETPVTCNDYKSYLAKTGYVPTDPYRWLENWVNDSTAPGGKAVPAGFETKPVTYLSLAEARAYCASVGKRLPRSVEWQYAGQGTDGRAYPWGSDNNQSNYPVQHSGNSIPGPEDVFAHPGGASPYGVLDMVGNVWHYTDEVVDDHTRAVITVGGSNYYPQGSMWYFPQAKQLNTHNKYFLMDHSYERAGTLGFRCAADAPPVPPHACGAPVCGSINPAFAFVDLTHGEDRRTAGWKTGEARAAFAGDKVVDWAHWGGAGGGSVPGRDSMAGGSGSISAVEVVGAGSGGARAFGNNPTAFSWSDGVPTAAAANVSTGIYVQNGKGGGFALQVKGGAAGATLKLSVYVGVYGGASALFSATLGDGSGGATYNDANMVAPSKGTLTGRYTVLFTPPQAHALLNVSWTQTSDDGNITLEAATVEATGAVVSPGGR